MWLARRLDGSDQISVWELDPLEATWPKGPRNPWKITRRQSKVWRFGTRKDGPVLCGKGVACIARTRTAAIAGAFWAEAA